jgi:hypothetical protein
MKLRTLTREDLYEIEERVFRKEDWLSRERTYSQLRRTLNRWDPKIVLHTDPKPIRHIVGRGRESESWPDMSLPIWNIYLAPEERTYHWLIHEIAHCVQHPGEEEEHSPEWLLHYIHILRTFRRNRPADNLLKALT